jgi:hypothetical protein
MGVTTAQRPSGEATFESSGLSGVKAPNQGTGQMGASAATPEPAPALAEATATGGLDCEHALTATSAATTPHEHETLTRPRLTPSRGRRVA